MTNLSWRREAYAEYVKPETWVLGGPPLGREIFAKVIARGEQWFWYARDLLEHVGPFETLRAARLAAQRHVEQNHPPPLN